jgi:hypothetical protein
MKMDLMLAIFNLRWLVITSLALTLWFVPVATFAFSVEQSAYDWDVAASDTIFISLLGDDVRTVEAELFEMIFPNGDAEAPLLQKASPELRESFTFSWDDSDLGRKLVVRGDERRLALTERVPVILFSSSQGGGSVGVRKAVAIPLFLRSVVDLGAVSFVDIVVPRVTSSALFFEVIVENAADAPVVPNGSLRLRPLFFGDDRSLPVNPGRLRIPAHTTRTLALSTQLPFGVWSLEGASPRGEVARIVFVFPRWIFIAALSFLAILLGYFLRRRHASRFAE